MKKFKSFVRTFGGSLAALALVIGTLSADSACILYFYQPKVPAKLTNFKK